MQQSLIHLKVGDKVKLRIKQPAVLCSGRKPVECYYQGKVVIMTKHLMLIAITRNGEKDEVVYSRKRKQFLFGDEDLEFVDAFEEVLERL